MSFNSTAFIADRERLLEPDQQLRGTQRRWRDVTPQADKNKWLDGLNTEEREQLRHEWEYEHSKLIYQQ